MTVLKNIHIMGKTASNTNIVIKFALLKNKYTVY